MTISRRAIIHVFTSHEEEAAATRSVRLGSEWIRSTEFGLLPRRCTMRKILLTLVCCLVVSATPVGAQPSKPGPEHEMLKKFEGNWDATVSFGGQEAKGQSVYKLGFGGLWLT